jgi:hypothetical protein
MMKDFSNTQKRVAFFQKQLEKAMPAVRQQIKVYESHVKTGTTNKSPLVAPQFKHA